MGIVKALAVFAISSIIILLITIFSPPYYEISKDSLNSILKNVKYQDGTTDLADINNTLDFIPADATLSYKDKVISSNIDKTSQDKRVAEGEKTLSTLTKSVQSGDLTINYKAANEASKYVPYIIIVLAGLFSGLAVFIMDRMAKKEEDMLGYLRGEIQRLEVLNQGYEAREKEFSKKIEKNIPVTLDEAQKLLKTTLKEKEIMINEIEDLKSSEDKLNKTIERNKSQLAEAENKSKDLQGQLSKLTKQDKLVEELKARYEKHKVEIKEHKARIAELEQNNPEKLEAEIEKLKGKIADIDEKYKASKEEIKELSKFDGEKLSSENTSLKDKIKEMKAVIEEQEETLKSGTVADLVKEKQEKEEYKKEVKELKAQLEDALNSLESTDAGRLKKENMELESTNKELTQELTQVKRELDRASNSESLKIDMIKNQLIDKNKESEKLREELDNALSKIKSLEESKGSSTQESNTSITSDNSETIMDNSLDKIRALENELEKSSNIVERLKRERDEKIKNFEELNEAFKNTNFIIHKKDQEMSVLEEKIKELESSMGLSR